MNSTLSTAEWEVRLRELDNDCEVAAKRFHETNDKVTGLLAIGCTNADKIQRAKANSIAAKIDFETLQKAQLKAESHWALSRVEDENAARAKQLSSVKKPQKKRAKELKLMDTHLQNALKALATSEETAIELHGSCGAVNVKEVLNTRHGNLAAYFVVKFLDTLPHGEQAMASALANHKMTREQLGDRDLPALQPNFVELYEQFQDRRAAV